MTGPAHTPTRVQGSAVIGDATYDYDYVGCSQCRIEHPLLGDMSQPWHKAHPGPLPATAKQDVPDSGRMRR